MDAKAKTSLQSISAEPWERAEAYWCDNNGTVKAGYQGREGARVTNASKYPYTDYPTNSKRNPDKGDVCSLGIAFQRAAGHSHPLFEWPTDAGVKCGSATLHGSAAMEDHNREARNLSDRDKKAAREAAKPLYLVVPKRDCVKVYRKNKGGGRYQSACLK